MKITAIIVLALALMGCDGLTKMGGYSGDIGEFALFRDAEIFVSAGDYQAGIKNTVDADLSIITTGGILINGQTEYYSTIPGDHWLIISTGSMNPGDAGTIESTRIDGSYYLEEGPEYASFVLTIEVE